ncbi:MFS transporter [Metabacillus arenae]|uniref:MFS transporter n=1 Tax=Metabacillus arenae TaxID=2771434 RepID=A0A926NNE3_9BACI|nr:MFS transporter [Metabacillus arenae]MBD1381006.1 MFS transporter [Metabacillus arenae]
MNNRYRFFIMSLIIFINIVNYVDRGAISYASEYFISEYHLTTEGWGQVLGFFGYGYIFGALLGGILVDKLGPKLVWILAACGWSIFVALTPFAGQISIEIFGGSALFGLAVVRIMFGLAEAPFGTAGIRSMANWTAPRERAFANSIGVVGVPIGALLTAPVAVGLLSIASYKMMFVILGAIGIVWAIIWSKVFTNRPEDNKKVTSLELAAIRSREGLLENEITIDESEKEHIPWYTFFKNPTLIFNALGWFCGTYIAFVILTWTPKYLMDTFNYGLSSLWYLGMIPWIGAVFTIVLGGKISDKLKSKTGSLKIARSGLTAFSYFCTAVCFILTLNANSAAIVILLMCVGNAFNFLSVGIHWTVIVDTAPSKIGTFGGMTQFIQSTASILGPTLTGILVASNGYTAMFIGAAVAALLGSVAMLFVNPRKKPAVSKPMKSLTVNE